MDRCPGQDLRYLKPEDVRDERCPRCGGAVEFFKDDRSQKCRTCGTRFRNPRLDMGCAKWCPHAEECIDFDPDEGE
jgi:hypothetical protein